MAAQKAQEAEKLARKNKVDIKIVFPDQSSVSAEFYSEDTAADLYGEVRKLLARQEEPFGLSCKEGARMTSIQNNDSKLIKDLKLTGRVLVRVLWGDGASLESRRGPSLRKEVTEQAQVLEVPRFENERGEGSKRPPKQDKEEERKGGEKKDKIGVPKWLKMGKK